MPGAFSAVLSKPDMAQLESGTSETAGATAQPPAFCKCSRCSHQSVRGERRCCRIRHGACVLHSSAVPKVIDAVVVKVAVNLDHHNLCEDQWQHSNRNMRHAAYRQFVLYMAGNTGRHRRLIVPLCVTWAIRRTWPSEDIFLDFITILQKVHMAMDFSLAYKL